MLLFNPLTLSVWKVIMENEFVLIVEYYLGLTFPHSETKTEGLLGFLERKITDKTYDKAKEAIFQLIEFILVQRAWKVDVDRFCIGFKVCHF